MSISFSRSSDLNVSAEEFLETLTMAGVNAELGPFVRMNAPTAWAERSILTWPEKERLFSSWIVALGVIPIDRHDFYFEAILPESGFKEASSSLTHRLWTHHREVVPIPGGCRVSDRVAYESRLPILGHLLKPVYQAVFWWRHRRLRLKYGQN